MLDSTSQNIVRTHLNILEAPLCAPAAKTQRQTFLKETFDLFKKEEACGSHYVRFKPLKNPNKSINWDELNRECDAKREVAKKTNQYNLDMLNSFEFVGKWESFFEGFWRMIGFGSKDLITVKDAKQLFKERFTDFSTIEDQNSQLGKTKDRVNDLQTPY